MKPNIFRFVKLKVLFSYAIFVFLALSCSFVRTGCGYYTKNAEKDNTDEIQEIVVSETAEGTYLTAVEWIFQGKRQTRQGIRGGHDGWWEIRVSCYDLSDGELLGRQVFGRRDEAECVLLGDAGGMLWFASADKELGFHAREIPSLEVAVTEKEILDSNPGLELDKPEWNYVSQAYRFDKAKKMPLIKDKSGKEFYINPSTLKKEEPGEILYYTSNPNATTGSVNLAVNKFIEFNRSGNIVYDKKETTGLGFIKGEFLQSAIPVYIEKTGDGRTGVDQQNLITEDSCLFVLSQNENSEDSECIITQVKMNLDKTVSIEWQTELEKIYRYPETVLKPGFIELTFGKGNPEYKTMKAVLTDEGLIFIYNLRMFCFDVNTGEVNWEMEL